MPSAATRPCISCGAASSRYNCPAPTCGASTCSAPCSKKHKLASHAEQAGPSAGSSGAAPTAPRGMLVSAAGPPVQPQRPRDHAALLADLSLLSHIGSAVSSLGREAVQSGLVDAYEASLQPPSDARQGQKPARQSHAQTKRVTLGKQLAWKRLPVMLLPEGMQMRGENGTGWRNREKMFAFTVELRFPYAPSAPPAPSAPSVAPSGASGASAPSDAQGKDASASTSRILLHRVPGARTAHALFVAELRARALKQAGVEPAKAVDATAPAAGKGKGKKAGKEMDTQAADEAEVFKAGWPRSALLSAGLAAHAASGSSDAASLPADALVLLRVHAQRLRNESSARFARWWAAQVRRGAVDADNVASFETQQAARAAAEEEAQMREEEERQAAMQQAAMRPPPGGYAGPPPGYASSSYYTGPPPPHAPPPQAFPAPAPAAQHALARLTSGALLGSLGAKLRGPNVAVAGAAPSAASAPQAPGPSAPAPPASPAPPKPAPPAPAARHFVSLRPSLGLEATLAALPAGYAIVEYPQLELWPQGEVEEAEREGRIEVLELEVEEKGEGKRARDGEEEEEEEEGSKRARVEGDEEEAADAPMTDVSPPPQPAQLAAPALRAPAPAPAPAPSGLISLAAYDSDSDSSSDGDSSTSPAAAPAPAARQLSPEQLRSRQLARSELLSAAPHPSSSSSEPEDEEGEGEEEARGSVADIARMLGMAPAVVVAKEEVKPKTALKKLPMPMREEEEEVDWGED